MKEDYIIRRNRRSHEGGQDFLYRSSPAAYANVGPKRKEINK